MACRDDSSKILYFLAGFGLGAVVALLLAPQSGEETREFITSKAEKGKEYLADQATRLRKSAEELADKGRKISDDWADKGKDLAAKVGIRT